MAPAVLKHSCDWLLVQTYTFNVPQNDIGAAQIVLRLLFNGNTSSVPAYSSTTYTSALPAIQVGVDAVQIRDAPLAPYASYISNVTVTGLQMNIYFSGYISSRAAIITSCTAVATTTSGVVVTQSIPGSSSPFAFTNGLVSGTTYSLTISCSNSAGIGTSSNSVNQLYSPAFAPSSVVINATSATSTSISLSFSVNDGGSTITACAVTATVSSGDAIIYYNQIINSDFFYSNVY